MMARRALRQFQRSERGATIIEFALLAPVLLLVLLGSVTAFDLLRNAQSVEKATFTIGDMLSRQTSVSASTLTGMLNLMLNVVPSAHDGGLRISSIARDNGAFVLRWSHSVGSNVPTTPIPTSILPEIANGDTVLVTESFVPHEAMFAGFGFSDITFTANAVHRPRFVTAIPFQ
ncbi:TadE/TadG family type IV pilus assembly protein [Devosia riboflavina]|uniref:TadE/TadG family type IV pilus assembly protein n=1 Tax=Devosia riboflavina TaxID=46914 RepID=UPI000A03684D|nr:TadE/TadG family type IV pilus assembly protein [Devosia riboflavina]